MSSKVQRVMTQPINLIFRFLQNVSPFLPAFAAPAVLHTFVCARRAMRAGQKSRVQLWLFEQTNIRIEGRIMVRPLLQALNTGWRPLTALPSLCLQGFDEYMNLVLDDAAEVNIKKKERKSLGALLVACAS